MKTILALLLILSTQAYAQQRSSFDHGVECKEGKNGLMSRISQIENLGSENGKTSFRMVMSYGRCQSIDEVQGPVKVQKRMLQISRYGLNLPFQRDLARVESFEPLSETELLAIISVDENSLKNKNPRRFTFRFWAQDWVGFPWVMSFQKANDTVTIDFRGFEEL